MRRNLLVLVSFSYLAAVPACVHGAPTRACTRPAAGSEVQQPFDLRSDHGLLRVVLKFASDVDEQGHLRYCYLYGDSAQAPTLRVDPGDEVVLTLENGIPPGPLRKTPPRIMDMVMAKDACSVGPMGPASTNLHFHGLAISPGCHQDDVLRTVVGPSAVPFEYRFQVPGDQPPGLYWYHPHLHGFTKGQVLGGASGALIVEGIERVNSQLAGLPERLLVIRDQDLANPDAPPSPSSAPHVVTLRDAEGDILNTGTDGGIPAKDLSLNFVPVTYPDYRPARIAMKPGAREFWRVLNASGITYADVQVLYDDTPQSLGVAALDGVPIDDNGAGGHGLLWKTHILLPPAGRAEFILKGPPLGTDGDDD